MFGNLFDFDDGDYLYGLSENMAMDSDGNMMMKVSGNMAMDMETGEMHMTSCWDDDDEEDDW